MRRSAFIAISFSVLLVSCASYAGEAINVPSDHKASYSLVELNGAGRYVEITTKRDGPSGTSYTKRGVDCETHQYKYLAEGETLAELKQNEKEREPDTFGPLEDGSISDYVAGFACASR
jgi:hypothetical protein